MIRRPLHTVVETPEFRKRAARLLDTKEQERFIDYIAGTPDAGDKIPGTGGARKVRWGTGTRGKSGGVRVITFYSGPLVPVFLLTLFGKGERADLSRTERNELRKVLSELVAAYRRGKESNAQGR